MNLLTKFSVGQYVHGNRSWLRIIDSRLKIIIVMIFLITPIWAGPIWRLSLVGFLLLITFLSLLPSRVWWRSLFFLSCSKNDRGELIGVKSNKFFPTQPKGMVLILRVTPLAQKDVKKLRKMVEELYVIARDSNSDIARLGEERIIVTPPNVKIWKPDYDLK